VFKISKREGTGCEGDESYFVSSIKLVGEKRSVFPSAGKETLERLGRWGLPVGKAELRLS